MAKIYRVATHDNKKEKYHKFRTDSVIKKKCDKNKLIN